jgi:hypothetical protein
VPPVPVPAPGENVTQYVVEVKSVECRPGQDKAVTCCPRMTIPEGNTCCVSFDGQEAVLGKCASGCCASGCCADTAKAPRSNGRVQVHVWNDNEGVVNLDVDVQQTEIEHAGKEGVQVLTKCLHAVRHVKPGKATRMVVDRAPDGSPCRWIELTVRASASDAAEVSTPKAAMRAPCCGSCPTTEALGMPVPCAEECEVPCCPGKDCNFWSMLGELAGGMAGCFAEAAPCHPAPAVREVLPQPVAVPVSAPVLPEPLPLAQMALPPAPSVVRACPAPMSCCGPVCSVVQPCVMKTADAGAGMCVQVAEEGGLECCTGDTKMSCRKMTLKVGGGVEPLALSAVSGQVRLRAPALYARADRMSIGKDVLVLEGHVRMCYSRDGQEGEVIGRCVEVNVAEGTFKVKP